MVLKYFGCCLGLLLALNACYYDNKEDLYSNFPKENTCDTLIVGFSQEVLPLITQQCTGCHNTSSAAAGLVLTNHATIAAALSNRPVLNRINRATGDGLLMPPSGKLTPCQIATITAWQNQGLLNN